MNILTITKQFETVSQENKQLIKFDDFYEMLSDNVRMTAYRDAINNVVKQGDVVIDLGAGTGILGIFAVKAGASKVYMIEKSNALDLAKQIVLTNGYSDKVVFINKSSLEAYIDEKVDVIVSETLGSFGLDENTLEFIIDARDRFLKPEGKLIPENISLKLTPVESKIDFEKLEFWKNIQGIDFSPAYNIFSSKMMVVDINPNEMLAETIEFAHIDFYSVTEKVVFNRSYHAINRMGTIYGFAGWFETILVDDIKFSTSPLAEATHWKQAFFPIKEPINVVQKDLLEISMIIGANEEQIDNTYISYEYRCTQRSRINNPV